MSKDEKSTDLGQLLDQLDEAAAENERVSLDAILDHVGRRSFGPLLLVAGLITLAPVIGDIPGVPTILGLFVFLVGIQLTFGRKHFWLPNWLLERSIASKKLQKSVSWLRRPARFIDRHARQRLRYLVRGIAHYVIAIVCLVIAAAMPVMEVVPFSANGAGAALTAFGLALIAEDGLLALFAFAFTALTVGLITYNLIV